jgi:hypothetical protein
VTAGIIQIGSAKFEELSPRLIVPFRSPTLAGSTLAVTFIVTELIEVRIVDDDLRWWCMQYSVAVDPGSHTKWVRGHGGPAGVTQITGETADRRPVNGTAFAIEAQGATPNKASDLLAEMLLRVQFPESPP